MSRDVEAGATDGVDRIGPAVDSPPHQEVDSALVEQVVRQPVVGHEPDPVAMPGLDQRQERFEVAGHRPLSHHQEYPALELLQALIQGCGFVVRGDPGRQVGLQVAAREGGRVALRAFAVGFGQQGLAQVLAVPLDHGREAHDFGHPDHPGMV